MVVWNQIRRVARLVFYFYGAIQNLLSRKLINLIKFCQLPHSFDVSCRFSFKNIHFYQGGEFSFVDIVMFGLFGRCSNICSQITNYFLKDNQFCLVSPKMWVRQGGTFVSVPKKCELNIVFTYLLVLMNFL